MKYVTNKKSEKIQMLFLCEIIIETVFCAKVIIYRTINASRSLAFHYQ